MTFLEFMQERGFDPPKFILDGTIKRFNRGGKKNNGWYIGFQNHSATSGKSYVYGTCGDWVTGEKHEFKPAKMSREDSAVIKQQMAAAKQRQDEEKELKQNEAAEKAQLLLQTASAASTPYTMSKCIDAVAPRAIDGVLIISMADINGKVWGAQRIYADGTKKFLFGQKIIGTMHVFGSLDKAEDVYICEGYATAASIYLATNRPTVAAFNTANFVQVSTEVRKKLPNANIVICADNDLWVKNQKGEPWNPGLETATAAAKSCNGSLIVPQFKSIESKPTDFNDLHVLEGLEAVKFQFGDVSEASTGFIPLGYDEGTYFFYDRLSKDLVKISAFTKSALFQLAPIDFWNSQFAGKNGFNVDAAANFLIQTCREIGTFDAGRIRGAGVWMDGKDVVVNLGKQLLVNGEPGSMRDLSGQYVYAQTKKKLGNLSAPLSKAECLDLIKACTTIKWRNLESGYFLAGWLALARVAGALPYHPHIWITGDAGTGKSTVMDRLINNALGTASGRLYAQGGTTEAGLRQTLKSASIPVIFDEFDNDTPAALAGIINVLSLFRNAWSQSGGKQYKGSAGGTAQEFCLAFCGLLSSVRVVLTSYANESRFSVLDLMPHKDDLEHYALVEAAIDKITYEYGERLFARSVANVKNIMKNFRVIKPILAKLQGQRFSDQTGMLLAGLSILMFDETITPEIADELIERVGLKTPNDNQNARDHDKCLHHLLTSRVSILTGLDRDIRVDRPIEEIIHDNKTEEIDQLKRYGLLYSNGFLSVASNHAELRRIYANTAWADSWSKALSRVEGATRQQSIRLFKSVIGGYKLPIPV